MSESLSYSTSPAPVQKPKTLKIDIDRISSSDIKRIDRSSRVLIGWEKLQEALVFFKAEKIDETAVKGIYVFQKEHGLKPDGIIGDKTYAKIKEQSPVQVTAISVSSETINLENDPTWGRVYTEFLSHLNHQEREKIATGAPCVIVNADAKMGAYVKGGKIIETFTVLLWNGGVVSLKNGKQIASLRGKGSTGANIVYRFDAANIAKTPDGNASMSGKVAWVVGAALISPEGRDGGGRWFHGTLPEAKDTHGCVGMPGDIARQVAMDVRKQNGGFWYVAYSGSEPTLAKNPSPQIAS